MQVEKKLSFKRIIDVEGQERRYPRNPDYVAAFIVSDLDSLTSTAIDYYFYCLCTKRDYSTPDIIHVSQEVYEEAVEYFQKRYNKEICVNIVPDVPTMIVLIDAVRDAARIESTTIAESLKLN